MVLGCPGGLISRIPISMKALIPSYQKTKQKVQFICEKLSLPTQGKLKGRKLAISKIEAISLHLYKQSKNIKTKKALHEILEPPCSYKTLVVSMISVAILAAKVLAFLLILNRRHDGGSIKHTDSTDVPVCLNKNAKSHKTMKLLANWGKNGKGWFYGLKMHITSNLKRNLLAVKFTSGNTHDKTVFMKLNKGLKGLFVADSGYVSKTLAKEFYEATGNILITKPRKNMKRLMTKFEEWAYGTRMLVELNFRNLKEFFGLITSLPRSVNGYLANYIYSLLAYVIA